MKSKRIIIAIIVAVLLISIVGVTFAAYTYTRQGTSNSKQIVGDIYMHYNESTELSLSNAMPREDYIPNQYFQFTIDGKNTNTKNDIYYDIILSHGDVPNGKTEENRIQDKFLKFRLVEVINNEETEIFNDKSYSVLTEKRIHVETIPKNTNSEVTHTYRLYMWISNYVVIGNTDTSGIDYDMTTWSNLFASIKVKATGDFTEKSTATDANCFEKKLSYVLNNNMSNNELQSCVEYVPNSTWSLENNINWDSEEMLKNFCNGLKEINVSYFQDILEVNMFAEEDINYFKTHNIINSEKGVRITDYDSNCGSDVVIPSTLPVLSYLLNINMTNDELQSCINYVTNTWEGKDYWQNNETPEAFCQGTGTNFGYDFQKLLETENVFSSEDIDYLQEHNIIKVQKKSYFVKIIDYAFAYKQLTSVEIPNGVTIIKGWAFERNNIESITIPNTIKIIYDGTFSNNLLKKVNIPNGIIAIDDGAFERNNIESIVIPNSVIKIGTEAFEGNQLTSVKIGNGIKSIGFDAFRKDGIYGNLNLKSITIDKSCGDIKNNLLSGSTNYYPWLHYDSPYTGIGGVTIYGSNNTVCDTFPAS